MPSQHSPVRRFVLPLAGIITVLAVVLTYVYVSQSPSAPLADLKPGMPAPDFSLDAVRGGAYSLANLRGQVVLLSFLDSQADPTLEKADPSRSQIVFLKSMEKQYGGQAFVTVGE